MPHRLLTTTPASLWSAFLAFMGAMGITIAQTTLKDQVVEILGVLGMVLGGLIWAFQQYRAARLRAWTEQQHAEREEFKEWAKVKGPSLEAQIQELKKALELATANRELLKRESEHRQTLILDLTDRLERIAISASKSACPFMVDGEARCRVADNAPQTFRAEAKPE